MPRKPFEPVQLPPEKPDRCFDCPLLGIIRDEERVKQKSKKTHVCIGTRGALTKRGIKVRASAKDVNHPWHRPCDGVWGRWMTLPGRKIGILKDYMARYREPFIQQLEMKIDFNWDKRK
jgi:hypothetical protein